MIRGLGSFVVLGVVAAGIAGALALQRGRNATLHFENDSAREQAREAAQLRQENARLAAQLPTAARLESLRSDHLAVVRLRQELEALQAEADHADSSAAAEPRRILAAEWRNVGRATPADAVETLLWAAGARDVATLAGSISFAPATRPTVDAFFASVPASLRIQYPTPELLVASLTLKDVPLGALTITGQHERSPDDVSVAVQLEGGGVPPRATVLSAHRDPDGWRLRVPPVALRIYANVLGVPVP